MEALSPLIHQIGWLALLGLPVATIAWTVTHEEIFREPREWCEKRAHDGDSLLKRKFFYLFTCEYCFSHWVGLFFAVLTRFRILLPDWRGYLIGYFALVGMANIYLTLYGLLRQQLKHETMEAKKGEQEVEANGDENGS
jgi:Protein of unknown function (DUF1360)